VKDRALYHLLLSAARSARTMVVPAQAQRIDRLAEHLQVRRAGAGRCVVEWSDGGPGRHEIAAGRFDLYRRGDVPALVARRPADLDARQSNWLEAHRLWGELIDDPGLANCATTPSRSVAPRSDASPAGNLMAAAALAAAAAAAVVPMVDAPWPVASAFGGLCVAGAVASPRQRMIVSFVGLLSAVGVAMWVRPAGGSMAAVAAGVGLLVAAAHLAPRPARGVRSLLLTAAASVVAGAAMIGSAPIWLVGAGLLVTADGAALLLRRERYRLAVMTIAAASAALGGLVLRAVGEAGSVSSNGSPALALSVSVAALVILCLAMVRAVNGVHDRLSTWAVPVVVTPMLLWEPRSEAALVLAMTTLAALLAATFLRRRSSPPPAVAQRESRTAVTGDVAVSIGVSSAARP
jgi:hypothetical protein